MDIASRAALLRETAEHHDQFEKTHAQHNRWDWYAAYIHAREHGITPIDAADVANRYMEEVLHVATILSSHSSNGTGSDREARTDISDIDITWLSLGSAQ